ncbi:MAG: prepilin-type N-terminal cleavage/methylation domain-containing protein [Candidatus Riflebacteria bacterium]|nr:prepilin-type N-terminal cleavage/methylation domain-containing protein [Candidatus Riflebacteria bacterium]
MRDQTVSRETRRRPSFPSGDTSRAAGAGGGPLPRQPRRAGFTLIEMMVAFFVLGMLMGGCFQLFSFFTGKQVANISARFQLQMEVRRALVNLYGEAQEGIEVLKPDPGSTLPYLVLRDLVNDLHLIFLRKDDKLTEKNGSDTFRLWSVVYNIEKGTCREPHEILSGIRTMNFTAHGFGSVVVSGTLQEGQARYSFLNMIRLKNVFSEEGK